MINNLSTVTDNFGGDMIGGCSPTPEIGIKKNNPLLIMAKYHVKDVCGFNTKPKAETKYYVNKAFF